MKIRTFCFAAAFGATIFACSGKNSDVTDSTDNASEDLVTAVCAKSACGPELGMPAEICPDGSIGGNTGRCVETKSNAVCHWEIRKCPAPTPTPICDCGPINFLVPACPDGSTRKPICEPLPTPVASSGGGSGGGSAGSGSGSATPGAPPAPGPTPVPDPSPTPGPSPVPTSCGWVVPPCATPPPPVCDCGPKPDYLIKCSDGSVVGPVCEPTKGPSAGVPACGWVTPPCPGPSTPPDCSKAGACPGPAPESPTYLCADGKTTAGPECVDVGGKCGWEITSCPVCDPAGPAPKPGCSWDSKACAWLCL